MYEIIVSMKAKHYKIKYLTGFLGNTEMNE